MTKYADNSGRKIMGPFLNVVVLKKYYFIHCDDIYIYIMAPVTDGLIFT